MDVIDFFTVIGTILGLGVALDRILPQTVNARWSRYLLQLDRKKFPNYVAGRALDIFDYLFSNNFFSKRFIFRSLLYSILFSIISLSFLYIYYPHTFFKAVSGILYVSEDSYNYPAMFLPIGIFLLCDYVCNGQTKYFLGLMRACDSVPKFLLLGYSDFIVTTSIGIFSIAIAAVVFVYLFLAQPIENVTLLLRFDDDDARTKTATLMVSRDERTSSLNELDRELVDAYPGSEREHYLYHQSGSSDVDYRLIRVFDGESQASFLTDIYVRGGAYFDLTVYEKSNDAVCHDFAYAMEHAKSRFQLKGWDPEAVKDACKNNAGYRDDLEIIPKLYLFDYIGLFSSTGGDLIHYSLSSITEGFKGYYAVSATEFAAKKILWPPVYINDNAREVSTFNDIFGHVWAHHFGSARAYVHNGYPWSTFFVVTLLTSVFIWVFIFFFILVYPFVWLLEKSSGEWQIRIREYPWTSVSVVCVLYFVFLFTLPAIVLT